MDLLNEFIFIDGVNLLLLLPIFVAISFKDVIVSFRTFILIWGVYEANLVSLIIGFGSAENLAI